MASKVGFSENEIESFINNENLDNLIKAMEVRARLYGSGDISAFWRKDLLMINNCLLIKILKKLSEPEC
jgi:hypothetical protein